MRQLPTGTVTFLFTDVEGSTRLLDELGADGYAAALAHHRGMLREAFTSHGGVEVDTQGDAFFVAFSLAPAALAAAHEAQCALAAGPVGVRMGVHTGTPILGAEGYVGMDVHRAARIAGAAHGRQVVVSAATAGLVRGEGLRDLGEHRFKDLSAAERVYQLGDGEFPPLRSLQRTNLPVPATPFLGRDQELASVVELLARPGVRLLTLTGPGGTGKTRLALQAAAEASDAFPDGITWVPLAPLRDAALVPATAAQALEVQELPDRPLERSLHDALTGKRVLLLLDNAEHLLPDVAARVSALADTPGPSILVTSRERLRTQGEHAYAVPPLSESDGTRLFVTRARQVDESFAQTPEVEELCRRLDDLPLALELAAARTAVFSAEQLLERLSQRLDLLKGGRDADPRQATLRATIDWSYELLGPPERRLFAALAVFAGGCSYEAAEEVAGADPDSLQSLIDKSLVRRRDAEGGSRYWMLATIHEFAAERFGELDDADAIRSTHAEYFAAFAELADPALRHGPAQQGWSERLAADYDNVRAAVDFALGSAPELALRLVGSVTFFVWLRGGFAEARAWVDASLARGAGLSPQLLARVHECGAVVAERVGDLDRETWHADESYRLYASVGDQQGLANALRERGKAASAGGNQEVARDIYTELVAHADRIGDAWNGAIGLNNLGDVALQVGDWERAVELCGRSSELRTSLGDRWGSALARGNVALAEIHLGRLADAGRSVHAALEDSLAVNGTMVISACLDCCCALASALGLQPEAARLIGAAERLWEELGVVVRESFEAALFTSTKGSVRAALGEAAFATELERGRGLTLDEAAALVFAVADRSKAGAD